MYTVYRNEYLRINKWGEKKIYLIVNNNGSIYVLVLAFNDGIKLTSLMNANILTDKTKVCGHWLLDDSM